MNIIGILFIGAGLFLIGFLSGYIACLRFMLEDKPNTPHKQDLLLVPINQKPSLDAAPVRNDPPVLLSDMQEAQVKEIALAAFYELSATYPLALADVQTFSDDEIRMN